jgi:hypothetical protein
VKVFWRLVLQSWGLRAILGCLAALELALAAGCTSSSPHVIENQKPVHPVSGKLTVAGRPAGGAFVLLVPVNEPAENPDPRPRATTAEDGTFALSTYGENDGAPAGEYIVTVYWEDPDTQTDKLKERYRSAATSKLRATVKEGSNELSPYDLK